MPLIPPLQPYALLYTSGRGKDNEMVDSFYAVQGLRNSITSWRALLSHLPQQIDLAFPAHTCVQAYVDVDISRRDLSLKGSIMKVHEKKRTLLTAIHS